MLQLSFPIYLAESLISALTYCFYATCKFNILNFFVVMFRIAANFLIIMEGFFFYYLPQVSGFDLSPYSEIELMIKLFLSNVK